MVGLNSLKVFFPKWNNSMILWLPLKQEKHRWIIQHHYRSFKGTSTSCMVLAQVILSPQNLPSSMLWGSHSRSLHQTTFDLVGICTNITATDVIVQISEGEECKWVIQQSRVKGELTEKQPHSDIALRRDGLALFTEKWVLLFFKVE